MIDQRTGQPANDSTPPQFLVTATPTPTTTSANGQQNQAQAAPTPSPTSTPIPAATTAPTNSGGNAVPPSGGNPVAVITAPNGSVAAGSVVQITGTATSIAFDHYTLQYSSTALPGSWVTIGTSPTPVTSGTLGTWVLSGVPSGQYVIRLVVADKVGQTASSIAQIAVQ